MVRSPLLSRAIYLTQEQLLSLIFSSRDSQVQIPPVETTLACYRTRGSHQWLHYRIQRQALALGVLETEICDCRIRKVEVATLEVLK